MIPPARRGRHQPGVLALRRLARRAGAFFIRRQVKGDRVYTAVLRAYVKQLLRDRFPRSSTSRAARSRTGKLLFPKTGPGLHGGRRLARRRRRRRPLRAGRHRLRAAHRGRRLRPGAGRRREEEGEPSAPCWGPPGRSSGATSGSTSSSGRRSRCGRWPSSARGRRGRAVARPRRRRAGPTRAARWSSTWPTGCLSGIAEVVTITPVGLVAAALLSHVRRGISARSWPSGSSCSAPSPTEGGARFARPRRGAPATRAQPGPIHDAVATFVASKVVGVQEAGGQIIYQVLDEKRPVLDFHRNADPHRFVGPSLVARVRAARRRRRRGGGPRRAAGSRASSSSSSCTRSAPASSRVFRRKLAALGRLGAVARTVGARPARPGARAARLPGRPAPPLPGGLPAGRGDGPRAPARPAAGRPQGAREAGARARARPNSSPVAC